MIKKLGKLFLTVSFLITSMIAPISFWKVNQAHAAVNAAYFSPAGLALGQQTKIIPVSGKGTARPSIYWSQKDDGSFQAGGENGLPIVSTPMEPSLRMKNLIQYKLQALITPLN